MKLMFWFYFSNFHIFPNLLMNTCAENSKITYVKLILTSNVIFKSPIQWKRKQWKYKQAL